MRMPLTSFTNRERTPCGDRSHVEHVRSGDADRHEDDEPRDGILHACSSESCTLPTSVTAIVLLPCGNSAGLQGHDVDFHTAITARDVERERMISGAERRCACGISHE